MSFHIKLNKCRVENHGALNGMFNVLVCSMCIPDLVLLICLSVILDSRRDVETNNIDFFF